MYPSFHIGDTQIFSYPLIIGMVWSYSYFYLQNYIVQNRISFPKFSLYYFLIFLSAWVGAKFLFLITLSSPSIKSTIVEKAFWLGGGFVFYGGLIFGGIFSFFYKKYFNISWKSFKIFIPVLCFGHAAGRIACFLAGCCFGTSCSLPWSFTIHNVSRHPVQIYESIILFIMGMFFFRRVQQNKPIIVWYVISYSFLRIILEFFRGDEIRGGYGLLSTSQWISVGFIIISCIVIYKQKRSYT